MTTNSVLKVEFYLAKLGTCSFYQGPSTLLLVLVNIIFYTLLKTIMFYTKKTIIIANFNLYIQNPFLAFLWVSIWKMNLKFMFQDYSTLCVLATRSFFFQFLENCNVEDGSLEHQPFSQFWFNYLLHDSLLLCEMLYPHSVF